MTTHKLTSKLLTSTLLQRFLILGLITSFLGACANYRGPYTTQRDNTAKGAGIGAAAGAVAALIDGQREADEILAGAAIGAVVGGGIGAYMDAQEERLARIPGTSVERVDRNTLLVHFNSDLLFDVDSSVLDSASRNSLNNVSSVIQEFKKTAVVVQGHTDSTGTESHNQTLSEQRARSVQNYLIGAGVSPSRLTAIGYGEGYPVASNASSSGRQQNRRVDVMLRAKAT